MKTTIDISDPLLVRAKRLAAEQSTTLKELVELGLRHELRRRGRDAGFTLRDARVAGRGLQEEFREAPWDHIRDAAYQGRGA